MEATAEMIEVGAKAGYAQRNEEIRKHRGLAGPTLVFEAWDDLTERAKEHEREIAKAAISAALAVMPKHKIEADGPPCPTCGFAIRSKRSEPFRFDDVEFQEIE